MHQHFADRLIEKIETVGNYGCLGVDPRPDWNPYEAGDYERQLIGLAGGRLAAAKPQAAFLNDDPRVVRELCAYARFSGMLSIADVKRGDIGTTAEAYAETWLRDDGIDAVTLNPFLGGDSLEPWIKVAAEEGKGVFVLVRTSNPGANDIQDRRLDTGITVSEEIAMMVNRLGAAHLGSRGYSFVGAVIGATVPPPIVARLRELMPTSIFLMPGLGAQGGKQESVRAALDGSGLGVLAPSSRSLNYPWKAKDGSGAVPGDWRHAVGNALSTFAAGLAVPARAV